MHQAHFSLLSRTGWFRLFVTAVSVAGIAIPASGCSATIKGNAVISTIPLGDNVFAGELAIDPASGTLYAATIASDRDDPRTNIYTLSVIDMTSKAARSVIPLPAYPSDIAFDSTTRSLYVVSALDRRERRGLLTVIDGKTNAITANVHTGTYSMRVDVDENTHTAYILSQGTVEDVDGLHYNSTMSALPEGATSVTAAVPVAVGYGKDIAVEARSNTAFVVDGEVDMIDLVTHSRTRTSRLPYGESARAEIALFDSGTGKLVVVNQEGDLVVADSTMAEFRRHVGFGKRKDSKGLDLMYTATLDPATHTVYVAGNAFSDDTDEIKMIDTVTGASTGTLRVEDPHSLAVDSKTHTLYVLIDGAVAIFPSTAM
ncbi:hypothetical protein [Nocardia sp. bgisy134]|uniref:hypothetical protein n=1 Tax=Nocardia sp. bgisy134 TaxID=3413789 RepID=UPI003D7025A6